MKLIKLLNEIQGVKMIPKNDEELVKFLNLYKNELFKILEITNENIYNINHPDTRVEIDDYSKKKLPHLSVEVDEEEEGDFSQTNITSDFYFSLDKGVIKKYYQEANIEEKRILGVKFYVVG
jgi:hypothetical protein